MTRPMVVELHDRTKTGEAGRVVFTSAAAARWEALLPRAGAAPADGALSQFDADELVIKDIEKDLATAGDNDTHGAATVWLSPLLSRSRERLALLQGSIARAEASESAATQDAAAAAAAERERLRKRREAALATLGVELAPEAAPAAGAGAGAGAAAAGADAAAMSAVDGALVLTTTVDVVPKKQRVVPKGVPPRLSDEMKMLNVVGAYTLTGTRLRVTARLTRPLHENAPKEPPKPLLFTRMALCMKVRRVCVGVLLASWCDLEWCRGCQYPDDALLKAALAVVEDVNRAAVPHAESIRSYALTDDERKAAESGALDIISGFQVRARVCLIVSSCGDPNPDA